MIILLHNHRHRRGSTSITYKLTRVSVILILTNDVNTWVQYVSMYMYIYIYLYTRHMGVSCVRAFGLNGYLYRNTRGAHFIRHSVVYTLDLVQVIYVHGFRYLRCRRLERKVLKTLPPLPQLSGDVCSSLRPKYKIPSLFRIPSDTTRFYDMIFLGRKICQSEQY